MKNTECPVHATALADELDQTLPAGVSRGLYLALGWASLCAGILGIFLPIWPTTCFLLLSAWSFSRSSRRMYRWLHENRLFGEHLRIYRESGLIARRVRTGSLLVLWGTIGLSAVIVAGPAWLPVLLVGIASAVTVHLMRMPVHDSLDARNAF